MCGYFALYIEHASIICFWFYAKSPSTKQKTISVSQGWSVERVSFFQLAFIFLFLLTIHTNPPVEVWWWENAPLQSISKRTKQSKKLLGTSSRNVPSGEERRRNGYFRRLVDKLQSRRIAPILSFEAFPRTLQILSGISAFPCQWLGTHEHVPR